MTNRASSKNRFPLLELPDDVLANVLRRCPPGSIAGFPLPLALAQVRATGSVDPHWLRPLLHLASKWPAVLDRLAPHLQSIELLAAQRTKELEVMAPFLTRLERLTAQSRIPLSLLPALPTSLTELKVSLFKNTSRSSCLCPSEVLYPSLLRLTALEELKMSGLSGECPLDASLPRLRRLKCLGQPPRGLAAFAPNLEALETELESEDLELLPSGLTELRIANSDSFRYQLRIAPSQFPCTRLRSLCLPRSIDFAQLPRLVGALSSLTRLELEGFSTDVVSGLPQLLEALNNGREDLCLCLNRLGLYNRSKLLERLFRHPVEINGLMTWYPSSVPWAALTRLTRLELEDYVNEDTSWIEPLSQLPSLRDLEVTLKDWVPDWLGALTQCTSLSLDHDIGIDSTANLPCLQRLTRLRKCFSPDWPPVEFLAALPDCLTKLQIYWVGSSTYRAGEFSPDQLGHAIRHLTALEDLAFVLPKEAEGLTSDGSGARRVAHSE